MSDCTVQFYCPPMKIERAPDAGLFCHRTAAEPMKCTVKKFLNGVYISELEISPVTIPPTLTRCEPPLTWWVDACVGEGSDGGKCTKCNGTGAVRLRQESWHGSIDICAECGGTGLGGNRVRVELPKERVAFKWWHKPSGEFWNSEPTAYERAAFCWSIEDLFPVLVAEAIDAPVTLWLADGRIFKGQVMFPDVKIDNPLFAPVAEATTTTGGELVPQ